MRSLEQQVVLFLLLLTLLYILSGTFRGGSPLKYNMPRQAGGDEWERSCHKIAEETPEPYTPEYFHTGGQVDTGGVQWAAYQYEGNITKEDLQKAIKGSKHKMFMCKILDGTLYFKEGVKKLERRDFAFMEGVLLALQWFHIPDVDLLFFQDDSIDFPGGPVFTSCLENTTGTVKDGFTVPYLQALLAGLGPTQMRVMSKCVNERYPIKGRIEKVVWRGTSWRSMGMQNDTLAYPRALAVSRLVGTEEHTDCRITRYAAGQKFRECVLWANILNNGSCPEVAPKILLEDFNKYAFAMDIDGRGWSGRTAWLMLGNTPILKQRSRYPDYLTHLYSNQDFVSFFASDVLNVEERVEEVLLERSESPIEYHQERITSMREFAQMHLTHFGLARAMAYVLTVYANKITWKPEMEHGYVEALKSQRKLTNPSLPAEFSKKMALITSTP